MNAERLGRGSLGLDAAYCIILGVVIAAFAVPISDSVPLAPFAVAGFGVLVSAWGVLVAFMRRRMQLRRALTLVMFANIAAALTVAAFSVTAVAWFVVLLIITIAIDIALFAASQALALARMRTA